MATDDDVDADDDAAEDDDPDDEDDDDDDDDDDGDDDYDNDAHKIGPTSQGPILCVFLAYHKTSNPQPLIQSESVTTSAQASFCIVRIAHGGDGSGL